MDIESIIASAKGHWPLILQSLGAPGICLKKEHGPCPWCGGKDRFRFDNRDGTGSFICNQCGSGDGMTFASRLLGLTTSTDLPEVAKAVAHAIGLDVQHAQPRPTPNNTPPPADEQKIQKQIAAALLASTIMDACRIARDDHPYLVRKQITATSSLLEIDHAALVSILRYTPRVKSVYLRPGRILIVPITLKGAISSLEMISEVGQKMFLKDGAISGGGFWSTNPLPAGDGSGLTIFIGEGVSTTRSAEMSEFGVAIGVVAMMNGNLPAVAVRIRQIYPEARIVILADLVKSSGEPDSFAVKAANQSAGFLAVPDFGPHRTAEQTDWNDLMVAKGIGEMRKQLSRTEMIDLNSNRLDLKNRSQFGLSARFIRKHGDVIRYCRILKKWFVFDGTRWVIDVTDDITRKAKATVRDIYNESKDTENDARRIAIEKFALKSEKMSEITAMVSLSMSEVPILPEQFDSDPWVINASNGTIDLRTGALRKHDRFDYHRKRVDVDYDQNAYAPTWERFIDDIFCGDGSLVSFVKRALGYSLTGIIREQKLFFLYGKGSNGKSTFTGILQELFGDYGTNIKIETLLVSRSGVDQTQQEITKLPGMRFVLTSEVPDKQLLNESRVKDMTGGDQMIARFLYAEPFNFKPTLKLWIYGNHKPSISGTDRGIWRRFCLIPFKANFDGATVDTEMSDKLRAEMSGILRWMVDGCLEWQRIGLSIPSVVDEVTNEYKAEMDATAQFIKEKCVVGNGFYILAGELYAAYQKWCKANGQTEENSTKFGRYLTENGFPPSSNSESKLGPSGRVKGRFRYGLALAVVYEDNFDHPDEGQDRDMGHESDIPVTGFPGFTGFTGSNKVPNRNTDNDGMEGIDRGTVNDTHIDIEKKLTGTRETRKTRETREEPSNVVPLRGDRI